MHRIRTAVSGLGLALTVAGGGQQAGSGTRISAQLGAAATGASGRRGGWQDRGMRVALRVHPGAKRPGVGGDYDGALIVRVAERAVDGKATAAALAALAKALGLQPRDVVLVSGAKNRTKIIELPDSASSDVAELRSR